MSRKTPVSSSINFVSTIVYVSFLLNLAIAAKPKGFIMKMIRSDSKESPLYPRYANLTQAERFQRLVEQSKARVHHPGSARAAAYNQTSSMNPNVIPLKYLVDHITYIGEVGFGTFNNGASKKFYLVIDTGSDLTWTQCSGGLNYFFQDEPFYDPKNSRTYKRIRCHEFPSQCNGERCKDGFCKYEVRYGTGQVTSGDLAYEILHTDTLRGPGYRYSFGDTIMGCGFDQFQFGRAFGVPESHDGGVKWDRPKPAANGTALIAGILGLGHGELSLVVRLGVRFEYCLAPYNLDSPTYLRFGSETLIGEGRNPGVFSTPILQDQNFKTRYYLILEDISINHKRLNIQQSDFQRRGGTFIDSGTTASVMRSSLYGRVEEELINYFKGFGIDTVPGIMGLQTCFGVTDEFHDLPTMTFHFLGANYIIGHRSGMYALFRHGEVGRYTLCLGIISVPDNQAYFSLKLGAMQQSDKRILYDLGDGKLKFKEEECRLDS